MTTHDVFICWTWADGKAAAEQLQIALQEQGLAVYRDMTHGGTYEPLGASVERALADSRTLVAVVTPKFADSPHCRDELHTALMAAYHLDGDTHRVMAVPRGVSPDDIRPRELTAQRLPAEGRSIDDLASIVAARARATTVPFGAAPSRPDPAWYPSEVPAEQRLHGRGEEAWEVHEQLRARDKNSARAHPVVTVRGAGGIGKTALALQYARWFHRDHPGGVVLIRLGGSAGGRVTDGVVRARFDEQLTRVAERLGVQDPAGVPAALDRLGAPYLWIVDDVPTGTGPDLVAAMSAPTRLGRTLYTSRSRVTTAEVVLEALDDRAGMSILTTYRPPVAGTDTTAARDTARLLRGHPLGLGIAAGLTTVPGFTGYAELLEQLSATEPDRLQTAAAQLKDELPPAGARPFAAALLRSFDSAGDAAREMLCAASILAPASIPRSLLVGAAGRAGDIGTFDPDEGLAVAAGRGLLEQVGAGGYLMHAMIARAVRAWVYPPSRRARLRDGALAELTEAIEATRAGYRHREVLPLLPHVRAVAGFMPGGDPWGVGEDERHLLNESGRVQVEAGDTGAALSTFQLLDDACATGVDPYTRHVVRMGLAVAYEAEGSYERAQRLTVEAFEGLAEHLGPGDPDLFTARNNIGVALFRLGDLPAAHRVLRQVYEARRDHGTVGRLHPDTLVTLGNLAIVRGRLRGDPAFQARQLRVAHRYWTAVTGMWRRASRPDDPRALDAGNGLALSLRALGRREEALAVAVDVHAKRVDLLGADHPDTLGALENRVIIEVELLGGTGDAFTDVLNGRLAARPGHPTTRATIANILHAERDLGSPARVDPTRFGVAADLTPSGVRLDGEHTSDESDLLVAAVDLQQRRVDAFGPDDPRTMLACAYLAYAMALADQLDGQLETAMILADDAADGLTETVPASPQTRTAELIRAWINDRLAER